MAEDARPPVAIRIVRPYASEDEFLAHEIETVSKSSIVLIGAPSRPQGVVLRFEVTLSTGKSLFRGEGRVVASKASAHGDQEGLTLRFTRLDPRSKALVDRAVALKEARAKGLPDPVSASAPPAPKASDSSGELPAERTSANGAGSHAPERPLHPIDAAPAKAAPAEPPVRANLLERLRQRARGLSPEAVAHIVARREK